MLNAYDAYYSKVIKAQRHGIILILIVLIIYNTIFNTYSYFNTI